MPNWDRPILQILMYMEVLHKILHLKYHKRIDWTKVCCGTRIVILAQFFRKLHLLILQNPT